MGTTTRKPDDAIALLTAEHRAIEALFAAFEEAGEHAHRIRRALVDRMITELTVHTAFEEVTIYPVVRAEDPGSVSDVLEALEEHHVVAWQLRELIGMHPQHERFAAKVAVMIENVRHHFEEEEDETLFPAVRTHIPPRRLVELGRELQKMRSRMPRSTLPCRRATAYLPNGLAAGAAAHAVDRTRSPVEMDGA
jgi:hemerythrin superfamily protein